MSSSKRPFVISFAGLKIGKHEFDFEIAQAFFEEQDYVGIDDASIQVHLELEKKETMLIGIFTLNGWLDTACDRCMDPLKFEMNAEYQIIYKFGLEESIDESLVVMHPDTYEIDVRENIYELIMVSMPSKVVHPKGECNEEMMTTMEKYTVNLHDDEEEDEEEEDEDDGESPWDILKNLN
ncbi:MAG: DUF177 domain-containing protein [Bacteroidetes bacterium]|nr:DUF177 domain-containing protein [Bacteroidota bacterium]